MFARKYPWIYLDPLLLKFKLWRLDRKLKSTEAIKSWDTLKSIFNKGTSQKSGIYLLKRSLFN